MFLQNKPQVEQACSILQQYNFSEPRSKHVILDFESYRQNQKRQAKFTEKLLLTSPPKSEDFVTVVHKGDTEPLDFSQKTVKETKRATKDEKRVQRAEARLRTGMAFVDAKQFQAALATFENALIELNQKSSLLEARLRVAVSGAALRLADPVRAETEADLALALPTDDKIVKEAYLYRGLARMAMHREDIARTDFEASDQFNPIVAAALDILSRRNRSSLEDSQIE